jgi:hypothetical protein
MSRLDHTPEELQSLLLATGEQECSQAELAELEKALASDDGARLLIDCVQLDADLRVLVRGHRALEKAFEAIGTAAPHPTRLSQVEPAPVAARPPILGFLGDTCHGTPSYFSGWPVAYLVATVILALGLTLGAITRVSEPLQVVRQATPLPTPLAPLPSIVGQITGMVDCEFAEGSKTEDRRPKTVVSLGDKLNLVSGLLEITYDTGAQVILQGPVQYDVESPVGGFLTVGKLTARVDSAKPRAADPKSTTSNRQFLIPSPLFVIRTPTATVTDLGTEFGVEVARSGETTSHVFRGSVRVQRIAADGSAEPDGPVVRENQSVRVAPGDRRVVTLQGFVPSRFVRKLPVPQMKVFDLVDAVAGGDGYSGRRNSGIHPLTGKVVSVPRPEDAVLAGDGQYHRVTGLPFVDGVFLPNGTTGRVQVNSAGYCFDGFATSQNDTGGYVWAGGILPMLPPTPDMKVMPAALGGIDYSSAGHGLIYMHANKGVTFDLEAIRRANPDYRPIRFKAVAGDTGPDSALADFWVLADDQVRFRRREINSALGAMPVSVPIGPADRFLTLVVTDGGDGISGDWVIFGDPRLELVPAQAGERRSTDK